MKKIFVVDEDKKFQNSIKSLCDLGAVKLKFFKSSIEVLLLVEDEHPDLIFVNLELPDINDFVMYDLLKKANITPPVPVLVTYSEQSEKSLRKYKKMKFSSEGYHKKPISDNDIKALINMYLGDTFTGGEEKKKGKSPKNDHSNIDDSVIEEDGVIFSEILAETESEQEPILEVDTPDYPIIINKQESEEKQKQGVFIVNDGISEIEIINKTEKELVARVISLEKQNTFLRNENKGLSREIETFKKDIYKRVDTKGWEKIQSEKKIEELEKKLEQTESKFQMKEEEFKKYKKTEERLRRDISRLEYEKMHMEADLKDELTSQRDLNSELERETNELKEIKASLNASISVFEEEQVSLNRRLTRSEEDLDNLKIDLEKTENESNVFRSRIDELGELLQKALSLTQHNEKK